MSAGSYGEVPGLERVGLSAKAKAVICGLGLATAFFWFMAVLGVIYILSLVS